MKIRYRIIALHILLTLGFYFSYLLYFYFVLDHNGETGTEIGNIFQSYVFLGQYIWIGLLWIIAIIYGIISKRKEFALGGTYSLALAILLILAIINF
ncbi:MAG: hypothetical protein JXQ87_06670 [Bacteroidia bacterium]